MVADTERRKARRKPHRVDGFFVKDAELCDIRTLDVHEGGVGVYSSVELEPGQQGVIYAELPHGSNGDGFAGEVRWCMHDPMPENPVYSYRVGVKLRG